MYLVSVGSHLNRIDGPRNDLPPYPAPYLLVTHRLPYQQGSSPVFGPIGRSG